VGGNNGKKSMIFPHYLLQPNPHEIMDDFFPMPHEGGVGGENGEN
jgi:hypothetical protein